ncbi:MAG TPA: site-2 protease family protein [Kofleriaceae bacterium]|nr:site-2 protease family protein [Kofleriaceae bacterium]
MDFSPEQIRWIFIGLFVLIVSVALHEFGHAYMATRLGDDTPRRQGRVTLNPLAHADPIGTILLPLIGGVYGATGGFGWGKPVQWQASRIRRGISMSTANILVSIAGPSMNLLLATFLALINTVLVWRGVIAAAGNADQILQFAVTTNFVLFFFNLLPIPPLDGGHVAESLTPRRHQRTFENYAKYGPIILIGVIMIPQLRHIFLVPAMWCRNGLYDGLAALFGI